MYDGDGMGSGQWYFPRETMYSTVWEVVQKRQLYHKLDIIIILLTKQEHTHQRIRRYNNNIMDAIYTHHRI